MASTPPASPSIAAAGATPDLFKLFETKPVSPPAQQPPSQPTQPTKPKLTLPGGKSVGDEIYFKGESHRLGTGQWIMFGDKGEVVGPAAPGTSSHPHGLRLWVARIEVCVDLKLKELSDLPPSAAPKAVAEHAAPQAATADATVRDKTASDKPARSKPARDKTLVPSPATPTTSVSDAATPASAAAEANRKHVSMPPFSVAQIPEERKKTSKLAELFGDLGAGKLSRAVLVAKMSRAFSADPGAQLPQVESRPMTAQQAARAGIRRMGGVATRRSSAGEVSWQSVLVSAMSSNNVAKLKEAAQVCAESSQLFAALNVFRVILALEPPSEETEAEIADVVAKVALEMPIIQADAEQQEEARFRLMVISNILDNEVSRFQPNHRPASWQPCPRSLRLGDPPTAP